MSSRPIRTLSASIGIAGGLAVAYYFVRPFVQAVSFRDAWIPIAVLVVVPLLTGLVLYLVAPAILRSIAQLAEWLEGKLSRAPIADVLVGSVGLILGLVIASLIGGPLARIPGVGSMLPVAASVLFGYLGWTVAVKKRDDLLNLGPIGRFASAKEGSGTSAKLLDTSAIIDGRIADIYAVGFLEGIIIIPQFVLDELRRIADSSDALKRNRGRRGLDVLNRLQKELGAEVRILPDDGQEAEVDARLVEQAKKLSAKIVTNDFNLNKVAELQGVAVLNMNDLANALKPVVLPGEEIEVQIIREGKESGQGVGYLDDGTMIVVESGKRHIGDTLQATVTSVLQTSAGRMIFARPKGVAERAL